MSRYIKKLTLIIFWGLSYTTITDVQAQGRFACISDCQFMDQLCWHKGNLDCGEKNANCLNKCPAN